MLSRLVCSAPFVAFSCVLLAPPARADWPSNPLLNLPVCTAPQNQNAVSNLVTDLAGGVLIAWTDSRAGDTDIYAQHVLASGVVDPTWPVNGGAVCAAANFQFAPVQLSDGAGGAIIAWLDNRATPAIVWDLYMGHLLANGTMDPAWPASGLAVSTAPGSIGSLSNPIADGAGGALIAWSDTQNDTDVFAMRVLASGVNDPAWPVNGLAVCTAAHAQLSISALSDEHGGILILWTDFRAGAQADIYMQRVQADGTLASGWPVNGLAVCGLPSTQLAPSMASDGEGGAIVTWQDARSGTLDVYAQHVRSNGTLDPAWPIGGLLVAGGPGDQMVARTRSDGGTGVITVWRDTRSQVTTGLDLYAQHVLATGSVDPSWPSSGLAVCTAGGDQTNPDVVGDGMGGLIACWEDYRGGFADAYAQHVLASGTVDPAWPANGRAISTAGGSQLTPRALADGSGGAILAWPDNRVSASNSDIYAQRVQASGTLGGTVVTVPHEAGAGLALLPPSPNPWRAGALAVRFKTADEQDAIVELVDLAGRRILTRSLAGVGPGLHEVRLQLPARVPAGLYFVALRQGIGSRASRTAPVVVLR